MGGGRIQVELNCPPRLQSQARFTVGSIVSALGLQVRSGGEGTVGANVGLRVIYGAPNTLHEAPAISIPCDEPSWDDPRPLSIPTDFTIRGKQARFKADVLALAFQFLSRGEETAKLVLDRLGRFPYSASLYARNGPSLTRPAVNTVVAALREAIAQVYSLDMRPVYPGGRRFAVGLSHDVDVLWKWTLRGYAAQGYRAMRQLVTGHPCRAWQSVASAVGACVRLRPRGEDPFWSIDRILDIEARYGVQSTFFVKAAFGHRYDGADRRTYFRLLPRVVHLATDAGCEIGLHGSFHAAEQLSRLVEEKERLEQQTGRKVAGIRYHNLRFLPRVTPALLSQAGFGYDSTLGFAEHEGFRSGFTFPHLLYNDQGRTLPAVLELPLAVMDTTLIAERYRGLTEEAAWNAIISILSVVCKARGAVALLWHNDQLDPELTRGIGDLYERTVQWIVEHEGWATTLGSIAEFWNDERLLPVGECNG